MFLETLRVKKKLKFAWPRAGLEIPSIFCSTHGPRSVLVVAVAPARIVCQGQPNLTLGKWTLMPTRCSAAESATRTTDATALRKIRPSSTRSAVHLTQGGTRRRRGPGWLVPRGPCGPVLLLPAGDHDGSGPGSVVRPAGSVLRSEEHTSELQSHV